MRLEGYGARKPEPALRRPAAARRAGPRAGQPAQGAAARRAARRARPQAARADAGRAQGDPARGRHHLRLRHARPGRGADDERPDRGVQRRADRAGRHARRGLRAPGDARSSPASSARPTWSPATRPADGARPRRRLHRPAGEDPARTGRGPGAGDAASRTARVVEVVYAGRVTRFVVDLDAGGALVGARARTCTTTSTDVRRHCGAPRVRLERGDREHAIALRTSRPPQLNQREETCDECEISRLGDALVGRRPCSPLAGCWRRRRVRGTGHRRA